MNADRIIAIVCCVLLVPAGLWQAYTLGVAHGASQPVNRPVCQQPVKIWFGKEECYRSCRATERMEAVR